LCRSTYKSGLSLFILSYLVILNILARDWGGEGITEGICNQSLIRPSHKPKLFHKRILVKDKLVYIAIWTNLSFDDLVCWYRGKSIRNINNCIPSIGSIFVFSNKIPYQLKL
jgi:hypothetical protein